MPTPPPTPAPRPNPWLEKRKFVRFNPPAAAELTVPRKLVGMLGLGRGVAVRVIDLSEGGCAILSSEQLPKEAVVTLKMEVKELGDVLEIRGKIVRVTPPPPVASDWVIGLEFTELSKESQIKIAGWRTYFTSTMMRKKNDEKRRDLGIT
jgi:c-di-GMP-binding flagellar brake protein YcgR